MRQSRKLFRRYPLLRGFESLPLRHYSPPVAASMVGRPHTGTLTGTRKREVVAPQLSQNRGFAIAAYASPNAHQGCPRGATLIKLVGVCKHFGSHYALK